MLALRHGQAPERGGARPFLRHQRARVRGGARGRPGRAKSDAIAHHREGAAHRRGHAQAARGRHRRRHDDARAQQRSLGADRRRVPLSGLRAGRAGRPISWDCSSWPIRATAGPSTRATGTRSRTSASSSQSSLAARGIVLDPDRLAPPTACRSRMRRGRAKLGHRPTGRRRAGGSSRSFWVPAIVVGVLVLGGVTFRTTFQIEKLRQQSVVEATLSLANEKVDRLDKRIIEEDNVVLAEAELVDARRRSRGAGSRPRRARRRPCAPFSFSTRNADARRPRLRVARAAGGPEDDAFRRLLVERIYPRPLARRAVRRAAAPAPRSTAGRATSSATALRTNGAHPYLVVAWHDVPRIVHDSLAAALRRRRAASSPRERHRRRRARGLRSAAARRRVHRGSALSRPRSTTGVCRSRLTSAQELGARVRAPAAAGDADGRALVRGGHRRHGGGHRRRRARAAPVGAEERFRGQRLARAQDAALAGAHVRRAACSAGGSPATRSAASTCKSSSTRASGSPALIENVLDFAKFERGKSAFEFHEGDVGQAVARAVDVYRYRAEREGVDVESRVDPRLPPAMFDERALELLLMNLLDNALKYAKDGKRVTVEVRRARRGPRDPRDRSGARAFPRAIAAASSIASCAARRAPRSRCAAAASVSRWSSTSPRATAGKAWVESDVGQGAARSS